MQNFLLHRSESTNHIQATTTTGMKGKKVNKTLQNDEMEEGADDGGNASKQLEGTNGHSINQHENFEERDDKTESNQLVDRILTKYSKFLVKYPYVNIIIVILLFIWAAVIGFIPKLGAQKHPDFTKPTKGFEPRDTVLSNNKIAYDRLTKTPNEKGLQKSPSGGSTKRRRSITSPLVASTCYSNIRYDIEANRIIYEEKSGGNLMVASKLKSICRLQGKIMEANANYVSNVRTGSSGSFCPSHSIPNNVALLANRTSCFHITDADVTNYVNLLKLCASFYKDGSLAKCDNDPSACSGLPSTCTDKIRIIYDSFLYLSDSSFANNPSHLKLALVSERLIAPYDNNLYRPVYDSQLKDLSDAKDGAVKVVAFEFWDLKFKIFENKLFKEGALLSAAVLIVFIIIMLYSGSVFVGLMTFQCIIIACVLAYFFYGIVFRLSFFPFLNVLTLVFLVGIGADDAFVYMGAWKEAKLQMPYRSGTSYDQSLVLWTVHSLKHACAAMFVTSFTTAAAFYAGSSSKIIAIRCFGIYAGTSIIMNYLMMVVWFPVAVIISEKYLRCCKCPGASQCSCCPNKEAQAGGFNIKAWSMRMSQNVFNNIIPNLVLKLRFVWIVVLALLGIGGLLVLFVSPKLRLPVTKDFQMFSDSSSIEQYPLRYKSKFTVQSYSMPVYFVFGVKSENTAGMTNPDNKGSLKLQDNFSVTSPSEQLWLKRFCEDLANSSIIAKSSANSGSCSGILTMLNGLTVPCSPSVDPKCCRRTIPLPESDFRFCLYAYFNSSRNSLDGMYFDKANQMRALVITANTKFQFSEAYDTANEFYSSVESWFNPMKKSAPESFSSGFWHSYLEFYDLQKSLASGTQVSLGISVAIAFCVVLITTWNMLISIYTVISIVFVISASIGTLVLAGWRLNIMESMIFSVAAGLAVDFTLHFGVAYRAAPDKSCRQRRVLYSFTHIGSAVTMGAITTFISGLVMSPASVLVYIQLSHFLMVLMTFSWIYATFFFMPLCSVIGPTNDFCQLNVCQFLKQKRGSVTQKVDSREEEMQTISNVNT